MWAGVRGGSGGRRPAEQPGQRRLSPAAERQAAGVQSWRVEPGDSGGDGRKGEVDRVRPEQRSPSKAPVLCAHAEQEEESVAFPFTLEPDRCCRAFSCSGPFT